MATYFTVFSGLLFLLVSCNSSDGARIARQASRCNGETPCVPLRSCPALLNLLANPTTRNLITIREALCNRSRRNPMVCCESSTTPTDTPPVLTPSPTPDPTPSPTPPTNPGDGESLLPQACGQGATGNRIFNGVNVTLGDYPWMALLGYRTQAGGELEWACGGALINDRYILTAAHCVVPELPLEEVRLGEHNLDTSPDCVTTGTNRYCAPQHQSFKVTREQIISHRQYNTRVQYSDDIALIRLERPAVINAFVQPICLPNSDLSVRSFLSGRDAVVSGWGRTERGTNSRILKKVGIPLVDVQTCQAVYNDRLVPEQVCFGGVERRDSCNGDSGGPVFHFNPTDIRYFLLGVVSYGRQCGRDPAVYTDVASYRSWILQNLRA